MPWRKQYKRAIVLDIDENLVHSMVTSKPNPTLDKQSDFKFRLNNYYYYVFKRPGLNHFLNTVFKEFNYIGFWTTGVKVYAKKILKNILNINQAQNKKLLFIYTRGNCAKDKNGNFYKPLKKIRYYPS